MDEYKVTVRSIRIWVLLFLFISTVGCSSECEKGSYLKSGFFWDKCVTCPKGYFCPNDGMEEPKECQISYYCPEYGLIEQKICPIRSICPHSGMSVAYDCPIGMFCREKGLDEGLTCPEGTYNNKTGQIRCKLCEIGKFCPEQGMIVQYDCTSGYYCDEDGLEEEKECTVGHYCPQKSIEPVKCEKGNYCPERKMKNSFACQKGYYCDEAGLVKQKSCPRGKVCPRTGMLKPIACPAGHYCPANGMVEGRICPPRYHCPENSVNKVKCPVGHYCPENGMDRPYLCPPDSCCTREGLDMVLDRTNAGFFDCYPFKNLVLTFLKYLGLLSVPLVVFFTCYKIRCKSINSGVNMVNTEFDNFVGQSDDGDIFRVIRENDRETFTFRFGDGRIVSLPKFRICPFCHSQNIRDDSKCKHTTCSECKMHYCHICLSTPSYDDLLFGDDPEYSEPELIPNSIPVYRCQGRTGGYYDPCGTGGNIGLYGNQTKSNQDEWSRKDDFDEWKKKRV